MKQAEEFRSFQCLRTDYPTLSAIMSILPQGFRPMNSHSIFPQSVWWVVTQTLTP